MPPKSRKPNPNTALFRHQKRMWQNLCGTKGWYFLQCLDFLLESEYNREFNELNKNRKGGVGRFTDFRIFLDELPEDAGRIAGRIWQAYKDGALEDLRDPQDIDGGFGQLKFDWRTFVLWAASSDQNLVVKPQVRRDAQEGPSYPDRPDIYETNADAEDFVRAVVRAVRAIEPKMPVKRMHESKIISALFEVTGSKPALTKFREIVAEVVGAGASGPPDQKVPSTDGAIIKEIRGK